MSFWDGVASFGLGAQGFNDYTDSRADRSYIEAKRKRDEEISNIELERVRREDALGKRVRDIAGQFGLGGKDQLPDKTIDVTLPQMASVDEHGNAMPPAVKSTTLPAQANQAGMYHALADAYTKEGKFAEAEKIRQAVKSIETEGYGDIIKGVATGEDPAAIAQRFNQKGSKRVVNGDKQGDVYTFTYEDGTTQQMDKRQANDLGTKLGLFKKDLTILPEGSTAIDASGTTVATGSPKQHNIDPNSPAGIEARKQIEKYKADMHALTADKATELQRNVKFLVDKGIAPDEASAYERLRTSMTRDRAGSVTQIMSLLKPSTFRGKPEQITELRKNAESLYDSLHGSGATPKAAPAAAGSSAVPAAGPDQLGGPGTPGYEDLVKTPPAGYPDAKIAPDGKWYVKKGDAWFLVKE